MTAMVSVLSLAWLLLAGACARRLVRLVRCRGAGGGRTAPAGTGDAAVAGAPGVVGTLARRADEVTGRHSFSLIVPARDEATVLGSTLDTLATLDYPTFEVLVVIGADDTATIEAARSAADRWPGRIRVLVDQTCPRKKALSLNHALDRCRHDIVGVFDADSVVNPALLRAVNDRFCRTGADAVQAGNQPFTSHPRWHQLRDMIEFYLMFLDDVSGGADPERLIRLSGNSVFIRTDLLTEVSGWDPTCLTEDCELGLKLAARGCRLSVLYRPDLATLEETPAGIAAFVRQRTRWNQGFIQLFFRGDWRALPTSRSRREASLVLLTSVFRVILTIALSLQIVLAGLFATPQILAAVVPAALGAVNAVLTSCLLRPFARAFNLDVRPRHHAALITGSLPFQLLLLVAAARAIVRQFTGRMAWEKTTHTGVEAPSPRAPGHT